MKKIDRALSYLGAFSILAAVVIGCGGLKDGSDWTKAWKIDGKEQKLAHISGLVVDDKFAYVSVGGNLADQKEGLSGVRTVDNEKVYWANHGYYSSGQQITSKPIYAVAKSGGKPAICAILVGDISIFT